MNTLDDEQRMKQIDQDHMLARVVELPQACATAWDLIQSVDLPSLESIEQVVVAGMGGSAIGGDLVAALVGHQCPAPITVVRGYDLPAFVAGPGCLVVGSSYSGNTEETLGVFRTARERGASLVALTTGGEMARLAQAWGIPLVTFDYRSQPRAALGYSFTLLLGLLSRLGLVDDPSQALGEAVQVMTHWDEEIGVDVPTADNPAKRLALDLVGRLPVVYGAGLLEPVARRWKTQFNENSKSWAFYESMPELNHNAVVAYERSEAWRERTLVLYLRSLYDHVRVIARWEITGRLLEQVGVPCLHLEARGQSRLAQMLSLIYFGDLASVYLALAQGIDPAPVGPIADLKDRLARLPVG